MRKIKEEMEGTAGYKKREGGRRSRRRENGEKMVPLDVFRRVEEEARE